MTLKHLTVSLLRSVSLTDLTLQKDDLNETIISNGSKLQNLGELNTYMLVIFCIKLRYFSLWQVELIRCATILLYVQNNAPSINSCRSP